MMMKMLPRFFQGALILALVSVLSGCATLTRWQGHQDLPAFSQVDEGFYRGGQPSMEGLQQLAEMGVKTVIDLRHHSRIMDEEREMVGALGMRWVNLPMHFWYRPSEAQIQQFLSVVTDPRQHPVFVHCRQGRNRVGVMVAIYRIVHQGWTAQQAYAEGRRLGLVPWNLFTRHLLCDRMRRVKVAALSGL